jgi:pseudouridine synthase
MNEDDSCRWIKTIKMIFDGAGAGSGIGAGRARDPPAVCRSAMLLALLLLGLSSLHVVDSFSVKTTSSRPQFDSVPYRQEQQQGQERTVVLAYHKPSGVVTTHADDDVLDRPNVYNEIFTMKGYKTDSCDDDNTGNNNKMPLPVFEQVTNMRSRLHAIGRLDADTTGLLLLTNDGGLVHHVTNKDATTKTTPTDNSAATSATITKTYQAVIMGYHEEDSILLQGMRRDGVDIGAKHGGWTLPVDDLTVVDHVTAKSTTVSLTISQGKNRQIRRMFHAVGSGVMKLQRTHIGNQLSLDGLEEGEWRILSDQEVIDGLHWTPRALVDPTIAVSSNSNKNRRQRADTPRPKPGRRRRRS